MSDISFRSVPRRALGAAPVLLATLAAPVGAQSFTGTGTLATAPFVLPQGVVRFELEPQPGGVFAAYLLDERGDVVTELTGAQAGVTAAAGPRSAPAIGGGPSAVHVTLPRTGRYLLEVRADGPWVIRIADAPGLAEVRAAAEGALDGAEAAEAEASARWLAAGFLGGVVLGPIGTIVAVKKAGGAPTSPPAALRARMDGRDPAYVAAYDQAYRQRLHSARRTAALVGGITGTALLTFAILQATTFGDDPSSTGEKPIDPAPASRVPLTLFRIPLGR